MGVCIETSTAAAAAAAEEEKEAEEEEEEEEEVAADGKDPMALAAGIPSDTVIGGAASVVVAATALDG